MDLERVIKGLDILAAIAHAGRLRPGPCNHVGATQVLKSPPPGRGLHPGGVDSGRLGRGLVLISSLKTGWARVLVRILVPLVPPLELETNTPFLSTTIRKSEVRESIS